MPSLLRVALIGDYDATVLAHQSIPRALELAAEATGTRADGCWLGTDRIEDAPDELLRSFDAFWCVPASPYRSTAGALRAIQFARENAKPFLGTCGGFQHAILEFAANVMHSEDAVHAELEPAANAPVISQLSCSLVEVTGHMCIVAGSKLYGCYNAAEIEEGFHCNYGLNEKHRATLESAGMRFTAFSQDGTVRAFELDAHPFYVGTLFQPERAALRGALSPPVCALLRAASANVPAAE